MKESETFEVDKLPLNGITHKVKNDSDFCRGTSDVRDGTLEK